LAIKAHRNALNRGKKTEIEKTFRGLVKWRDGQQKKMEIEKAAKKPPAKKKEEPKLTKTEQAIADLTPNQIITIYQMNKDGKPRREIAEEAGVTIAVVTAFLGPREK